MADSYPSSPEFSGVSSDSEASEAETSSVYTPSDKEDDAIDSTTINEVAASHQLPQDHEDDVDASNESDSLTNAREGSTDTPERTLSSCAHITKAKKWS